MSKLADALRLALADRDSISLITLSDAERSHLRKVTGLRTALNAGLVEAARVNPRSREIMKAHVWLAADMGCGPEDISRISGGALEPAVAAEIINEWRRASGLLAALCPASENAFNAMLDTVINTILHRDIHSGPLLRWLADRDERKAGIRDAVRRVYTHRREPTRADMEKGKKLVGRLSARLERRNSPIRLLWNPNEQTVQLLSTNDTGT